MAEKKAKAVAKKAGRPTLYTPELVKEICNRLGKGEPLAVICRDEHMPSDDAVRNWQDKDADIARLIARARENGEDSIAADCLRIADTPVEGVESTIKADGSIEEKRGDMLGHRKLQIDTRLKLLAKWNPKKWGDKVAIGGAADLPPIQAANMPDAQLLAIAMGKDAPNP